MPNDIAPAADIARPPSPPTAAPPASGRGYLGLWRTVPRELGFLLPLLPIVVAAISVLSTLLWTGVGMITIVVGFFIVLAALYVARGLGDFELLRLRASGRPAITPPSWTPRPATGWISRVFGPFADPHYWMHLLHGMIVNFVLGVISWSITITWVASALGGLTYWIWVIASPEADRSRYFTGRISLLFGDPNPVVDSIFSFAVGLVFLATLPLVTRGLTLMHWGVAKGMLGAWSSDRLREQVQTLTESRAAASSAEGQSLRRLERDIHDGPQQRLVRLQMDLASAERQLEADPERSRALIGEALTQSKEALEELRALSRGFAPPLLLDRGLRAALSGLCDRGVVPARFVDELPPEVELPTEVERNAYFIAAEALTNAAKHAGARSATVTLRLRRIPETDDTWLDLHVVDDGRGGATPIAGHGLAGIDERLRGVGGLLTLSSPVGGGTEVVAHLPLVR
ncbi:sensor histidine kinase [Schumannella luteola]